MLRKHFLKWILHFFTFWNRILNTIKPPLMTWDYHNEHPLRFCSVSHRGLITTPVSPRQQLADFWPKDALGTWGLLCFWQALTLQSLGHEKALGILGRGSELASPWKGHLRAWDSGVLPIGTEVFQYFNNSIATQCMSTLNTHQFCDCPVQ